MFVQVDNLAVPTMFYCVVVTDPSFTTPILPSGIIFSIAVMSCTLLFEGYLIWMIQGKRRENFAIRRVYRNILVRVGVFSIYRIWALAMLFVELLNPKAAIFPGITTLSGFVGSAELVLAAGPLVAFLILSTRSDVLRSWGIKKQESSVQAMQDVDRERVFRKTLRLSWLVLQGLEENRSNETQIRSGSSRVSLEQDQDPYNQSIASASPATYSLTIKKPLPAIPRSGTR